MSARRIIRLGGVLVLSALAVPGAAKEPGEWRVTPRPLVVLPSAPVDSATVRIAQVGDELLSAPVGLASSAVVADAGVIDSAGAHFELAPGTMLIAVDAADGASANLAPHARVFCGDETKARPAPAAAAARAQGSRYRRTISLCLVDDDRDGRFEQAFVEGARWAEDRVPTRIAPLRYEHKENAPLKSARMVLAYRKGAALQGLILALDLQINSRDVGAVEYVFDDGATKLKAASERELRWKDYPRALDFGPVSVSVEGRNEADRSLRYRIVTGFRLLPIKLGYATRTLYYYR